MMQAKSIMLVDDERDTITVITEMLEKQGYSVHAFTDPEKALAHAKDCRDCGIIVSDIRMPGMNGFQLVRALKKACRDMKVVFMTAFEIYMREWQKVLPSTEVDQFLQKPVRMIQLAEVIERCAPAPIVVANV